LGPVVLCQISPWTYIMQNDSKINERRAMDAEISGLFVVISPIGNWKLGFSEKKLSPMFNNALCIYT